MLGTILSIRCDHSCGNRESVGVNTLPLLHRLNFTDLRNMCLEIPLNPHLQRDHAARTSHARTMKTNLHHSLWRDIHEFEIAAVGLDGWADQFDYARNTVEGGWRAATVLTCGRSA